MTGGTVLRGPADADHFRVKVGRYGDRWYTDPLPGCPIAQQSDWQGPSVSSVKKAASSDWTYVALNRGARDIATHPDKYHGEQTAIYEQLKIANKVGLDIDAGRGTIIHLWCEDLLHGRTMRELNEWDLAARKLTAESLTIALAYQPAILQWFDVHQPDLAAAEVVCIHRQLNGVGYGGTADTFLKIDGTLYVVDWKSRGPASDHGAYPEEAAQVAALAGAEYMIVTGPDGQARRDILYADGGLIVSIKPEGCRTYPIDLAKASAHWKALHAWWCARRTERDAIGRSWPARTTGLSGPAVPQDRRAVLLARYQAMSEDEQRAYIELAIDPHDLDAIEQGLDQVDKFNVRVAPPNPPVPPERPPTPTPPDEGGTVYDADVVALRDRYNQLDDTAKAWTGQLVEDGNRTFSFRINGTPTVRRYELYRAILRLARAGPDWANNDTLTDLLDGIAPVQTDSVGATLGHLDHHQAAELARRVDFYMAPDSAA